MLSTITTTISVYALLVVILAFVLIIYLWDKRFLKTAMILATIAGSCSAGFVIYFSYQVYLLYTDKLDVAIMIALLLINSLFILLGIVFAQIFCGLRELLKGQWKPLNINDALARVR